MKWFRRNFNLHNAQEMLNCKRYWHIRTKYLLIFQYVHHNYEVGRAEWEAPQNSAGTGKLDPNRLSQGIADHQT
jgi:hypothetical protein